MVMRDNNSRPHFSTCLCLISCSSLLLEEGTLSFVYIYVYIANSSFTTVGVCNDSLIEG